MRHPSRMIALLGLASLFVAPLPVVAAPAVESEEPPLDTDSEELPLDTDTDTDTDSEELPLDTDTDTDTEEPPPPELDEALDGESEDAELDDDYSPLRDSPEAKVARRWLGAGIASMVSGGALVGGAIALGLSDPCDPKVGNSCFTDSRNRAAATMGIPGGVMLLGGVAMTIVGALQKRRLFFEYAGSVSASRDHIGVVFVGRF
ncbi:MAG TPA: hypothetical protein VM869_16795 [Enhygromyxa sp.]|nr:hypothetical protein [Enhygromyxa sp.]